MPAMVFCPEAATGLTPLYRSDNSLIPRVYVVCQLCYASEHSRKYSLCERNARALMCYFRGDGGHALTATARLTSPLNKKTSRPDGVPRRSRVPTRSPITHSGSIQLLTSTVNRTWPSRLA